ncbi:hypothetical protein TeGR_g7270 [Tetraparma gracilis]|uniref:EF-hand domain-containing protein n=1 Tax=Tetraparma gracilis TaxID=2962635 RepID=A0ABQ6M3N8_9STRA|nr:hypothetical protein TeGR_g7270 [Tetraparma gracilis]
MVLPPTQLSRFARLAPSLARLAPHLAPPLPRTPSFGTSRPIVSKVRREFERYRQENYPQELRTRFAKEMVAAADTDNDGELSPKEIAALCRNICGTGERISEGDVGAFIEEVCPGGRLSAAKLREILGRECPAK